MSRPLMTSLAPSAASWRASTSPSPREPPVMTTILLLKLMRRAPRVAMRAATYPPTAIAARFRSFIPASLLITRRLRAAAFRLIHREAEQRVRLHAQVPAVVITLLPIELIRGEVNESVVAGRAERVRPDHARVGDEHA